MKRFLSYFFSVVMVLSLLMYPNQEAYAANVSLGVSASSVNIGENVTVSVTVPENITATVDLTFSTEVLSFVSASTDVGTNGGTVTINLGKMSMANSNSVTVTFKAATSGTASLNASVISAVDNDTVEDVALSGASASVTVANQTTDTSDSEGGDTVEEPKSGDNSLSSLKLSNGTLSPSFKYNVTKYTATVEYDVTKVVVSAKASSAKATIESVTGDGTVDLKVGENTIQVVVKAENGVKATYTIVVTRKAESDTPEPSESESESTSDTQAPEVNEVLQWNGEQLSVAPEIPEDIVPTDFEETTVVVKGQQMQALSFVRGDLKLLYLNNTNDAGSLYVYDEVQETIYPFIKIDSERSYVMVLLPNEAVEPAPEGFEACTFSMEGKGLVTAYQLKDVETEVEEDETAWSLFVPETYCAAEPQVSEFYLLYCMNDAGEKGWYMYDAVEGTFQRYLASAFSVQTSGTVSDDKDVSEEYAQLEEELKAAKTTQYIIIGVAAAVVVILIIIIVVLVIRNRSEEEDFFDEYEDVEYEDEEDTEDMIEKISKGLEETSEVIKNTIKEESGAEESVDDSDDLEFIEFE